MEQHVAKWMFVTDALRGYVTKRGVNGISAHGRAEILEVISREVASTRAAASHAPQAERAEMQTEISGALQFLHALRQADEALSLHA